MSNLVKINSRPQALVPFLDRVRARYNDARWLSSDPIEFVHREVGLGGSPWDQEVVALFSAQLAYGNVKQIRRSVEEWLQRVRQCAGTPSAWITQKVGTPEAARSMEGFRHRIHQGSDLLALASLLQRSWRTHGSLGAHFVTYLEPAAPHFGPALDGLIADWKTWHRETSGGELPRSLAHLLAAPVQGSCCKRWCMLLRWMGRKDAVDPGLWMSGSPLLRGRAGLRPDQLVMPLDTHVGRICQYLGLTRRKSLNWKAAVEITDALRLGAPEDPVKHDFALARLGILDVCRGRYVESVCPGCELFGACRKGVPSGTRARQKVSKGS